MHPCFSLPTIQNSGIPNTYLVRSTLQVVMINNFHKFSFVCSVFVVTTSLFTMEKGRRMSWFTSSSECQGRRFNKSHDLKALKFLKQIIRFSCKLLSPRNVQIVTNFNFLAFTLESNRATCGTITTLPRRTTRRTDISTPPALTSPKSNFSLIQLQSFSCTRSTHTTRSRFRRATKSLILLISMILYIIGSVKRSF